MRMRAGAIRLKPYPTDLFDRESKGKGKGKEHRSLFVEFFLHPIAAGLLMHGPGLKVMWPFEEWPEYLASLAAAATEGAFLLFLATRVFHAVRRVHGYLSTTLKHGSFAASALPKCCLACAALLGASCFGFLVISIVGDASFRIMSGNDPPTAGMLRAGLENPKTQVVSQFQHDSLGTLCRLAFAMACVTGSVWLYARPLLGRQRRDLPKPPKSPKSKVLWVYVANLVLGILVCHFNSLGWYTPVAFAYFSVFFDEDAYSSRGDAASKIHNTTGLLLGKNEKGSKGSTGRPNIIYLAHESLSGAVMLNSDIGASAMPWFQDKMLQDPDFYVFGTGRTVSGITIDALPALFTGCLPYDDAGADWVHEVGRPIGYDFFARGYRTAMFSSRALDKILETGYWNMLWDVLVGAMEKVVDPLAMGWPLENNEGSDDRRMLPVFEEWLEELGESSKSPKKRTPFYAQFYNFNNHFPYLKDPQKRGFPNRYYDSLATTDEFLQRLFVILDQAGQLENTIVVGSGDHGEDPFKEGYVRLSALNSVVLHTPHYIYYPRHLMPDPAMAERLRSNTGKLTHTLDMYPTIQSILNGGSYDILQHAGEHCYTGVDLTSVEIPEKRVTVSHSHVGSQKAKKQPCGLWALSTRDDAGRDWSLYHRLGKNKRPALRQEKNATYVLEYGNCTRKPENLCTLEPSEEHLQIFRGAVQWIKDTPLIAEGVRTNKLVNFFAKKVKWEETGN